MRALSGADSILVLRRRNDSGTDSVSTCSASVTSFRSILNIDHCQSPLWIVNIFRTDFWKKLLCPHACDCCFALYPQTEHGHAWLNQPPLISIIDEWMPDIVRKGNWWNGFSVRFCTNTFCHRPTVTLSSYIVVTSLCHVDDLSYAKLSTMPWKYRLSVSVSCL